VGKPGHLGLGLRGFCVPDPELAAELTSHESRFRPPTISRDATHGLTPWVLYGLGHGLGVS